MPQRLQLSRKKGYRLPLDAKSVARPSLWGDPFRVRPAKDVRGDWLITYEGQLMARHLSRADANRHAVELFQNWLPDHWRGRRGLIAIELRGLHLACYCPLPEPGETDWCHARVLLEEANQ